VQFEKGQWEVGCVGFQHAGGFSKGLIQTNEPILFFEQLRLLGPIEFTEPLCFPKQVFINIFQLDRKVSELLDFPLACLFDLLSRAVEGHLILFDSALAAHPRILYLHLQLLDLLML